MRMAEPGTAFALVGREAVGKKTVAAACAFGVFAIVVRYGDVHAGPTLA